MDGKAVKTAPAAPGRGDEPLRTETFSPDAYAGAETEGNGWGACQNREEAALILYRLLSRLELLDILR